MTARCCDLHEVTCETPGQRCCRTCSETAHPDHADGSPCVLTTPVQSARQMAETLLREFGQRVTYTDIWVRLPRNMPNDERTALAHKVDELIGEATVTIALPDPPPAEAPVELDYDVVIALAAAPRGALVHGWVVGGGVAYPDLTGQHLVISDQDGRFYAADYRAWSVAERGGRVGFVPVIRRPRTLDATSYEFVVATP